MPYRWLSCGQNFSLSVSARASSANIDTAYVAAYAGTSFWAWNFRSGATFAWNTIGTSRTIAFPSFFEQATTRYGTGEAQVFGELGYGPFNVRNPRNPQS